MNNRHNQLISLRKSPKQTRANVLIDVILEAAIQVLVKEGSKRFTTARIAERAGVSVGSLYQYFPNKAAILFRLQSNEWKQTTSILCNILNDNQQLPYVRLRKLVHVFIQSECEEAGIRNALDEVAPLYYATPEAKNIKKQGSDAMFAFIREVLSEATQEKCEIVSNLIMLTLCQVGKEFSEVPRTESEIQNYANEIADMFCAYLKISS